MGGYGVARHWVWRRCSGVGCDGAVAPRRSGRVAGSWNRAVWSADGYADRVRDARASSSLSRASSKPWSGWVDPLTRGGPGVAVEVDVQESGEAHRGAVESGLAGEFDDGEPIAP